MGEFSKNEGSIFLAVNSQWLQGVLTFHISYDLAEASTSSEHRSGPGRPTMEMSDASAKTKRRCVGDLVKFRSSEELIVAAKISSRLSGK